MKNFRHALFVLLLLPMSAFAQSADQEIVSAVDSPDPITPGSTLTYTVTARNNGPDAAVNGGININLPLSVTHTTDVTPAGWTCFWLGSNGSCITPSFPAGTTEVVTINVVVNASLANFPDQSISAAFFPSGTTSDPNNANNSKTATTQVDSPQVDLSVTATDSPDPVFPDGNVTYSVGVTNGGPDTASTVNFNVVPNSSLRFVSSTVPAGWNCTLPSVGAVNATFTCSRPTWAPGTDNFTVVFSANDEQFGLNDTTFQTNFGVNAMGSNETDNPDNTVSVTTSYVTPDADLSVTATDSPDPVGPDGDITYTVTVANGGPDSAAATLTVPMNNTLKFTSISTPAGFTCTGTPAPGGAASFSCANPAFANGASAIFTIVLNADFDAFGNFDQTINQVFSVSGNVADPDNTDNLVTVSTQYDVSNANLGVTATDAPDPVAAGNNITYTGSVTNAGPDTATTVTLTIPLHSSLLFQSVTAPAGFTCGTPAIGANGTITCTIASLPNGANLPFTLVAQTNPTLNNGPDGIIQQGFLIGSSTNDPVNPNNSLTVDTQFTTADANIVVTNSDSPDPVAPGGTITYTQTITNNGPDTAVNATFTGNTPAGTTILSFIAPAGWTCTTPPSGGTGAINCSKGTMLATETGTFTVVYTVTGGGPIGNTVTGDSDTYDPNPLDNSATASTNVAAPNSADLSITKSTPTTTAPAGSLITYMIVMTNNGPNAATTPVMTDALPATLLFRSITAPAGFTCSTPVFRTTGTISCSAATLANGASASFTLVVEVAQGASGSIVNGAAASSATADGNGGNSSVNSSGVVAGPSSADLTITKTTPTTSTTAGSNITYTITVGNAGPSTATNVVVNDTLPTGLQFVSATPSQGTCNAASPVVCNLGSILAGGNATVTLVAQATGTQTSVSNTATATSPDATGPDTATTPAIPVTTGEQRVAAIPTLSEWMLLVLASLLGLVALVKSRT